MDIVHTPNGTVANVTASLDPVLDAAEDAAATEGEKKIARATFGAIKGVLDTHPRDSQASVTAQIHTNGQATKVYVDITVVPSASTTTKALAASEGVELDAIGGQIADEATETVGTL